MLVTYVVVSVVCVLCVKYIFKFLAFRKIYNNLPGRPVTSFLKGNIAEYPGLNEAGLMYDLETAKKFKYLSRLWIGPFTPLVFLYHPDSMRQVFKSSAPKPRVGGLFQTSYDMMSTWLGEGLVVSNGNHWQRQRRLLTSAFHFEVLKQYHDVNNVCSSILMVRLKELTKNGDSVELYDVLHKAVLDVILRTAFSLASDCQTNDKDVPYSQAVMEMQELLRLRFLDPLMMNEWTYSMTRAGKRFYKLCDEVHQKSESLIAKRKQELEANPELVAAKKKRDFLDILLTARDDDGGGLTDREIRDEVDTFLFAGHETTSTGSMWVLYELAKHPEHQEKCYQEIQSIMGDNEDLAWEELSQLEFTTQCIKEATRLHSPVPAADRMLTEDVRVHEHVIPKGTEVTLYIWLLHNNPHLWEEPLEFRPERFHPDNVKKMDPFQFCPFSAGARNCIGQHFALNEMKVIVAKTIKNFNLTVDPNHKVERLPSVTMRSKDGIYLHTKPRQRID